MQKYVGGEVIMFNVLYIDVISFTEAQNFAKLVPTKTYRHVKTNAKSIWTMIYHTEYMDMIWYMGNMPLKGIVPV